MRARALLVSTPAFAQEAAASTSSRCSTDGPDGHGHRRRAVHHVVLVGGCRHRAHLHVQPGEEAVEDVRAAGRQAPQGRPPEGSHRALVGRRTTATATWPRWCSPASRNTSSSRTRGGATLNRDDLLDTVRRSIQRATALTSNDLKKGVSSLATIGATAPFVGLLGTVVGVINAFVGIASTGSGGIGAVSAGIAEALVETALGLFVAIPAVWFYNYLTGRLEYFNVEMDNSSSELLDYFIRKTSVRTAGDVGPCLSRAGRARRAPTFKESALWQWMSAAPKAASSRTST